MEGDGVDYEGHDDSETVLFIYTLSIVIITLYFVQVAGNPVRGSPQLIVNADGAAVATRESCV